MPKGQRGYLMAKHLSDYIIAVRSRLQEVESSEEISTVDITDSIELAVRHHSNYKPLEKVEDIAGSDEYDLTLPSSWEKDFSVILEVEYPQGSRNPTYIEAKNMLLYQGTSGNPVLRLLSDTPATGETVRLSFTHTHSVTVSSATIEDVDFWAVANLACSMSARVLAARYARVWDPVMELDVVNYRGKSDQYLALARECEAIWRLHLGISETGSPAPALQYGDWDIRYSWDRPLLVHKPRYR